MRQCRGEAELSRAMRKERQPDGSHRASTSRNITGPSKPLPPPSVSRQAQKRDAASEPVEETSNPQFQDARHLPGEGVTRTEKREPEPRRENPLEHPRRRHAEKKHDGHTKKPERSTRERGGHAATGKENRRRHQEERGE